MSFQSKVCPGLIGWVVVEQFAGMMYLLKAYYHIIVTYAHLLRLIPPHAPYFLFFFRARKDKIDFDYVGEAFVKRGFLVSLHE